MKTHFGFNCWVFTFFSIGLACPVKCLEALHLTWISPNTTQIRNLRSKIIAMCFYNTAYLVQAPPLACRTNILVLRSENPRTVGQSLSQVLTQEMSDTTIVLDVEYIYHDEVQLLYHRLFDRILKSEDLQLILLSPSLENVNIDLIKPHVDLCIITGKFFPWRRRKFIEFLNITPQLLYNPPEPRSLLVSNSLHCMIDTSSWFS